MHNKLVFFTLMIIFVIAFNVNAQIPSEVDSLQLENVTSCPGEVVAVGVHLVNTFAVGGISTRIIFDQDVFIIRSVSRSDRTSFMNIFAVDTTNTGVLLISATSLFPDTYYLPPGTGEIFNVEFEVSASADTGVYQVEFQNSSPYHYENHLSDTLGLEMILPVFSNGTIGVEENVFVDSEVSLPENYYTLNNYPNPFNNYTLLLFNLPNESQVRLMVFDILGREVKSYDLGVLAPGRYTTQWNGRDNFDKEVSTGVYSYALFCDDNLMITNKMVLLR